MTHQKLKQKIREAWIQGNIISFKKPKYKSAFFDLEEVLVLDLKTTETKLSKKTIKFLEDILLNGE